jgi:hypothetical protein
MESARGRQIRELFPAAVDLPAGGRRQAVEAACGGDERRARNALDPDSAR